MCIRDSALEARCSLVDGDSLNRRAQTAVCTTCGCEWPRQARPAGRGEWSRQARPARTGATSRGCFDGAAYRNRTDDLLITSETLYRPVSYTHLRAHETDSYLVC